MGLNNSSENFVNNELVIRFDLTTITDVAQKEKELTIDELQKVFHPADASYGKLKTTYYYTENNGELYGNDDVVQIYNVTPQNGKIKFTLTGIGTYNLSIGKEYLVNRQDTFKLHAITDFRYNYDGIKLTLRKKNKPKNNTTSSSTTSLNDITNNNSNISINETIDNRNNTTNNDNSESYTNDSSTKIIDNANDNITNNEASIDCSVGNDLVVRFDLTTAKSAAKIKEELDDKLQNIFFPTDSSYGKLKATYYCTENNGVLYGKDDAVQIYSVMPQNGKISFTLAGVGPLDLSIGKEYLINKKENPYKFYASSDCHYSYDGKNLTLRNKNGPTTDNSNNINPENNNNAINNETSAYRINSEEDLINIANIVNSGNDLNNLEVVFEKDIIITKEFPVIAGNSSNVFNGTLNGNKHKLTVAKPANLKCLIGNLGKNGSVKSLTINTCTLCDKNLCKIVDNNNGSVTDCKITENLINIVSQNVRCNKEQDKNKPIDRHAHLANILIKEMPDVIGFQEAGKDDWLDFLVNDLKDDFVCVGYKNAKTKTARDATPIFFRKNKFDLISSGVFWYNNNKEHFNKCQRFDEEIDKSNVQKRRYRVNHWAQLELKSTKQRFFIFNTHFPLGTDERRLLAIDILKERIASINNNLACPFFVTGDYNMEPNSDPYKKMSDWKSDCVCPTMTKRDISATNSNSALSTTVSDLALTAIVDETNNSNTFNGFKIRPKVRIDYCFGSSDLINVPSYKVILDTYTDSTGAKCPPSDHYGIKHTIDLK